MSAKIIQLRELLREKFPEAHAAVRPSPAAEDPASGMPCLDATGVHRGSIVELVTDPHAAGTGLFLDDTLRKAATRHHHTALVDGKGSFDPQSAGCAVCQHLLWVRCRNADEAVRSADLLLRDGNLPFILVDLQFNPLRELRQIRDHTWYRLAQLTEAARALCCVCTPSRLIPSARLRLEIHARADLSTMNEERHELATRLQSRVLRQRHTTLPQTTPLRRAG
jgi:hypothetical protein